MVLKLYENCNEAMVALIMFFWNFHDLYFTGNHNFIPLWDKI